MIMSCIVSMSRSSITLVDHQKGLLFFFSALFEYEKGFTNGIHLYMLIVMMIFNHFSIEEKKDISFK